MLPVSVRDHLAPAALERVERALAEPRSPLHAELASVLDRARTNASSAEQIALALGLVLTLVEQSLAAESV